MRIPRCSARRRSGKIVAMAALLLVPLMGMVAFGVDHGYAILVRTDLQHVADSAALAGVQQLMDPYAQWTVQSHQRDQIRTKAIASARAAAKQYAAYNQAGNVSIQLQDGDIAVGFTDAKGKFNANPPSTQFPNTVRVLARRDGSANGAVKLFFAPVIGTNETNLTSTASATLYTGVIESFKTSGANIHALPMTYDVDHWDNFIKTGKDPDGNTSVAADGTPQLKIYPSIKFTGNFGELALDDDHAGASEIKSWIHSGLPPCSVATLLSRQLLPLDQHNPNAWDWSGNPGTKTSTISAVNDYVGETFLLPLYKAKNSSPKKYQAGVGKGSHYDYNIVRFVPIRIMPSSHSAHDVIVQPSGGVDPMAVFDAKSIAPAGTSSDPTVTSLTLPKLSQ
jgi:Flp pilus assembly protein TadG